MSTLVIGGAVAGFLLGLVYFALLAAETRAFLDRAPLSRHLLLLVARILPAVLLFWLLVQAGAAPLLAGFAGFLLARAFVVRRRTV